MSNDGTFSSSGLGARLRASLTDEQITLLLDLAAESGQLHAIEDRLRASDPDLADTVRRILDRPAPQTQAVPSSHKIVEIWNDLWASWTGHVADVSEEKGAYANQDEHWHPPYLDHSALKEDLEQDATQILEWIDEAFPLVGEPDLFLESLRELNENMRSLPEWFQPVEDDFVLGPSASSCVLQWNWLGLARQPGPGPRLVDALCNLEEEEKHTELDSEACFQFFAKLPDGVCREIHTYLRDSKFEESLADRRNLWHRVQHEYDGRFDPAAHLRTCGERLEQDWHYGEPLVTDALSRQDLASAETFVELTFSSLLRWSMEEPWRPEKMLLPRSPYYRPPEEGEAMLRLLKQWESIATQRGKPGRVASLHLQETLLKSPENWAVVMEAFGDYERDPANRAAAKRLFLEWRQRTGDVCAPQETRKEGASDTWIHRLVDAQRNPLSDQEPFLEHVDIWLECCRKHAAFFQKNWRSLAVLTRYLPRHTEVQAKCSTFHAHVLVPALQVSSDMDQSLRQALAALGDKADRIDAKSVWEQHLHTLVSAPGGSGSSYRESAMWMRALSEVNSAGYGKLLARWKIEFGRRRNLWKDMASVGCPGL